tara:strand:- start:3984 stop:4823 length:840 start_codon:yes stop_codon:yes gene_type:complete
MKTEPRAKELNFLQEAIRYLAFNLPNNKFGKKVASLLLRIARGSRQNSYYVDIFENQRAVLHPFDNISEKRVFITPQLWEPTERKALKQIIESYANQKITFFDIGCNAGLYSLYVNSICLDQSIDLEVVAVEPDPYMRKRLEQNFSLSKLNSTVLPWALSDKSSDLILNINHKNRGQNSIIESTDSSEKITVTSRKLIQLLDHVSIFSPDVMKIDIEGAEHEVFAPFLSETPRERWPEHILMEGTVEGNNSKGVQLCVASGYTVVVATSSNTLLKLPSP